MCNSPYRCDILIIVYDCSLFLFCFFAVCFLGEGRGYASRASMSLQLMEGIVVYLGFFELENIFMPNHESEGEF